MNYNHLIKLRQEYERIDGLNQALLTRKDFKVKSYLCRLEPTKKEDININVKLPYKTNGENIPAEMLKQYYNYNKYYDSYMLKNKKYHDITFSLKTQQYYYDKPQVLSAIYHDIKAYERALLKTILRLDIGINNLQTQEERYKNILGKNL